MATSATLDKPSVKAIPTREEIPENDRWDLTKLYPTLDQWEKDFAWVQSELTKIDQFKNRLAHSAQTLLDCLEFKKSIDLKSEQLVHYATLQSAEDSSNTEYLGRVGQMQNLMAHIGEAASFLTPEIQSLSETTFEAYLENPVLGAWHNYLKKIRRYKPHTLSEKEERLLALGSVATQGGAQIFSQLTNVDLQFGSLENEKGELVELSQSTLSSFMESPDRGVRKKAFHQFYQEIHDHRYSLSACLANSVKRGVFNARACHYPSAIEASLFPDKAPQSLYDGLIEAVHDHLDSLHKYYALRKKILGIAELHVYDTYIPLVAETKTQYTYDEAIDLVLQSLAPLGDDYVETLRRGLKEERWSDRYESKGKRSGAFSSSSYGNPPYILMNYQETVMSDVYTLTHEAGHSMHTWYSQKEQSFQDYRYPIFLAEVASTFNEQLLTHYLLQNTGDEKMRAYIINREIDSIRGALYRQTLFAEFEKEIHAKEEKGEPLTLDSFKAIYRQLIDLYFGSGVVIDAELELECLRVPHFHFAFYVYKYATGISCAVALANKVLHGDTQDLEAYLGFLKSGGSTYPLDTLRRAGVDLESTGPIQDTLIHFSQRVDELEAILT